MIKNRRKTFLAVFAFAALIVTLSIFCLSTYAALPITGSTDPEIYYFNAPGSGGIPAGSLGYWSSITASQAVSLVKLQYDAGSFNNFRPVLLYYVFSGGSSTLRLILSDPEYGSNPNAGGTSGYQDIAGYFEPVMANPGVSSYGQAVRLLLTNLGFAKYYPGNFPTGVDSTLVLGYWDVTLDEFVYNEGLLTGGVGDSIVYNAYTLWNKYDLTDNAPTYSEGYAVGYDEGYDIGYTRGEDAGYRNGIYDGTHAEGIQLDIGGIIDSVIGGARTIITNAFGFELFGINIAGVLIAVVVVFIIGFIIKKFKGD